MKKIAVLQAEFDSDIMICDEDLKAIVEGVENESNRYTKR